MEGILLQGHQSLSFQRSTQATNTFANFVSAIALRCKCPCLLLTALELNHPNCNIWLSSFREEKSGIQSLNTYVKIALAEYQALHAKLHLGPYQQCVS
jgi:hypothetical protein